MSKKKKGSKEPSMHRWVPDPNRRNRVIPDKKKVYNRKALPKAGPSDVWDLIASAS